MDESLLKTLLDPRSATLVVVDVQNDYCHPDGALGRAGIDLSGVDAMCRSIERLRAAAATSGAGCVLLRTIHSAATDSPAWQRRNSLSRSVCREGTWGAESYGIAPSERDVAVTKHRYSGFCGTSLEDDLRAAGRTTLVLAGTATNVCVESTARDGCMRDFDVVVVEDATVGADEAARAASLENIRRYFGSVVTTGEVVAAWTSWAADPVGAPAQRR